MTRIQAIRILDPKSATKEAVQKAYRAAAFKFHPDHGGDLKQMQLVNLAMETLMKILTAGKTWGAWHREKSKENAPLTEAIMEKWNQIKHFPGIQAELCGCWLWISGETYPIRKELKTAGFGFSRKKSAWYWHEAGYRKRTKEEWDLNKIRSTFGSDDLETSQADQIAA